MTMMTHPITTLIFPAWLAHVGHHGGDGFLAGLLHPVLGPDHLAAILCAGLLSAGEGGRTNLRIPSLFVGFLLVGAFAGLAGWLGDPPEILLALSVCAAGFALLCPDTCGRVRWLESGIAVTAFLHGYAHGAEAPSGHAALFFLGFASGTSLLLCAGLLVSLCLFEIKDGSAIRRGIGGSALAAGLFFAARIFAL